MKTPLFDLIEKVAQQVHDGKVSQADGATFLRRVIHGPAIALVVKMTPTPLDDLLLEFFKVLVPAA